MSWFNLRMNWHQNLIKFLTLIIVNWMMIILLKNYLRRILLPPHPHPPFFLFYLFCLYEWNWNIPFPPPPPFFLSFVFDIRSDIAAMKTQGASGVDVIKAIVGNSSTFHTKTDFSKEKYLKKKAQKYVPLSSLSHTPPPLFGLILSTDISQLYRLYGGLLTLFWLHIMTKTLLKYPNHPTYPFSYCLILSFPCLHLPLFLDPENILNIRGDSLAMMLNLSNVFAHPGIQFNFF